MANLEKELKELEKAIVDMEAFVLYVKEKYKEMDDVKKKEFVEKLTKIRNVFSKYCNEIDIAIEKIS